MWFLYQKSIKYYGQGANAKERTCYIKKWIKKISRNRLVAEYLKTKIENLESKLNR